MLVLIKANESNEKQRVKFSHVTIWGKDTFSILLHVFSSVIKLSALKTYEIQVNISVILNEQFSMNSYNFD